MRSVSQLMLIRWAMLAATLHLAQPAVALDWNADEKAVWQLEEDYWRFVSTGDVESYVKLWHKDFVGWPCFEWNPARKGDSGKPWSCTMQPNTSTTIATARTAARDSGANSHTHG